MVVAGSLEQEAMTENCCGCKEDCSTVIKQSK